MLQWYVDRAISFNRLTSIKLTAFNQIVSITYVISNIKGKYLQHMYLYTYLYFDIPSGWTNCISIWIWYDCITSELYVSTNILFQSYDFICL